MALHAPPSGLRTIHNGSNGVAKASIVVAAGSDLAVTDDVAEQLFAASGAFKPGAAPQADAPTAAPAAEVAEPKRAAKRKS